MNLPETVIFTVVLAPGNRASLSVGPWIWIILLGFAITSSKWIKAKLINSIMNIATPCFSLLNFVLNNPNSDIHLQNLQMDLVETI